MVLFSRFSWVRVVLNQINVEVLACYVVDLAPFLFSNCLSICMGLFFCSAFWSSADFYPPVHLPQCSSQRSCQSFSHLPILCVICLYLSPVRAVCSNFLITYFLSLLSQHYNVLLMIVDFILTVKVLFIILKQDVNHLPLPHVYIFVPNCNKNR